MNIEKGARSLHTHRRPALFYGSAREGFEDYLRRFVGDGRGAVLLPAFIGWSMNEGSGVLDPVQNLGLRPAFYRLHRDLTIDVQDFEDKLSNTALVCVVIIHFYGRSDPSLQRAALSAGLAGVPLVEDLAHGLFTASAGGATGRAGEVSLYSLHKMLPIPDGGMVVYATTESAGDRRSTRADLATEVAQYDHVLIAAARRATFTRLTELLKAGPAQRGDVELLWPDLASLDVPQTLPLYVRTGDRDELYHRLNAQGYGVVSLYHTMVPQLKGDCEAAWSAAHILNLPVHQDVRAEALDELVARMEEYFDKVRSTG